MVREETPSILAMMFSAAIIAGSFLGMISWEVLSGFAGVSVIYWFKSNDDAKVQRILDSVKDIKK